VHYKNIPNYLTIFRIGLVPFFIFLMATQEPFWRYSAGVVFIVAALTDYIDGFLARLWNVKSDFGALMDPLADKLLVMAALVMLVDSREPINAYSLLPGWIAVLLIGREIWVTGLRGWASTLGEIISASWAGKVKTVLQMVGIVCVLFYDVSFEIGSKVLRLQLFGWELLLLSLFVSYWGAYEYTVSVFTLARKSASKE
jgi:CDP-diacylglycerol---glycerol-3-phosphate 3-phosphatidyltransferase